MLHFLHRDSCLLAPRLDGADAPEAGSRLVQVAFLGRGVPPAGPDDFGRVVGDLLPAGVEAAWVRQIHSADVVEARSVGTCGPADALFTHRPGLGLTVVTADCVPVLLAGRGEAGSGNGSGGNGSEGPLVPQVAAVHAGWRGVAAGIVPEAARRFAEPPATAWIGPAISGEVYEVGPEVAAQVAVASDESVVSLGSGPDGGGGREHVDLRRAVEIQLRGVGVDDVRHVDRCTFRDDALWSYRRDGEDAGRNLAIVWLEP